jgi:hypothetical protein
MGALSLTRRKPRGRSGQHSTAGLEASMILTRLLCTCVGPCPHGPGGGRPALHARFPSVPTLGFYHREPNRPAQTANQYLARFAPVKLVHLLAIYHLSGDTASGRLRTSIWQRVLYPHSPFGLVELKRRSLVRGCSWFYFIGAFSLFSTVWSISNNVCSAFPFVPLVSASKCLRGLRLLVAHLWRVKTSTPGS